MTVKISDGKLTNKYQILVKVLEREPIIAEETEVITEEEEMIIFEV